MSELKFVKGFIEIFDVALQGPIAVHEDNSGALNIAKYSNFTKNSKHIEVDYHFVNEHYLEGVIDVVKIDSNDNIADIFTKSLGKGKLVKFRELLNIR